MHNTIGVKFVFSFLFVLFVLTCSQAQSEVSWEFSYESSSGKVFAAATIGEGWHLYSTQEVSEFGPIPTEFEFVETKGVEILGTVQEPDPIVAFDANFSETLYYFENSVVFSQDVAVKNARELRGTVTYMVCNDSLCMPPVDVEFTIELKNEN